MSTKTTNTHVDEYEDSEVQTGDEYQVCCPVSDTIGIIGGKWKVIIIYHLTDTPKRFNELMRDIPAITQRMLTMQLKELARDGIVHRHDYREVPPKVDYSLTEQGRTLIPLLEAMHAWGEQHAAECMRHRMAMTKSEKEEG